MGALERDHVGRLFDHADQRLVPAGVLTDPAARSFSQVEADFAEADLLLDLDNRLGEIARVGVVGPQDVESEPCAVRGQPGELG